MIGALKRRAGQRVRVPTVFQMEAVECGAAALAMILAGFGRLVALEELRIACGVSRDGSKASNIVRAAQDYGLIGRGFKREPAELRSMPFPMILHWNFNHFVVLEGFDRRGRAYLNDPAHGPRRIAGDEFDQAFTGVALTFECGPEFRRGGESRRLLPALAKRLRGSGWALAYVVLAGIALVGPQLLIPTFSRIFIDQVLVQGLVDWAPTLLAGFAAALLGLALLTALQQRHLLRLETKIALSSSARFLWHVLHLPMAFFVQRFPGEIAARVSINDRVAQTLSGELATTVLAVVMVGFYAALMAQYEMTLTGVVVGVALLNIVALRYVSRRRADLSQRYLQDRGKVMGTAMGGLLNIESLKATGSESDFFSRWSGYHAKTANAQQQMGLIAQVLAVVPPLLLAVSMALVIGIGGLRIMDGRLTVGLLLAFQSLMFAFLGPVNGLVGLAGSLQDAKGNMNRLDDVVRYPAEHMDALPADEPRQLAETRLSGHVELRGLAFGYSRLEAPLIAGFDLVMRPGDRVALVGGSGSGKSTVARLIAGLYRPWQGEILLDGRLRETISRLDLANSIAVVDQDGFLFAGSARDNLTLWDATLGEADVMQAARDAAIHDDITARLGGYLGDVEENGRNFSGGQRQRMEIARALARNPTLLVLDEATSALDPVVEKAIDDAIRRRGCTCLIVAHRLSTIRDCDEIVVLDRGKIVQRGTHETLKMEPGVYQSLIGAE